MSLEKNVLGIVPGLQATALVGENLKAMKNFDMKKSKFNPKKPIKNMVKLGVKNVVGIGLIKVTADSVNAL